MKDLQSILKAVSRGKMDVTRAENLIQELFEASHGMDSGTSSAKTTARESRSLRERSRHKVETAKSTVDAALAQIGEKVGLDSLLKKSKVFGRKVEFRPEHQGFEARLSIFSGVEVSSDSQAAGNVVSGSQWKSAEFSDVSEVQRNHFTLSQLSNLKCSRSNFSSNELGLARLSDVTIVESRFENNRFSRSQCLDVSFAESDFTHNKLLRSDLSAVVLNASRIANVVLNNSKWLECEFDQSDIQGLKFENCVFDECRFTNCELVSADPMILEGLKIKGKTFEGLRTLEDWLSALEHKPRQEHNAARSKERPEGQRPHRRSRPPRDRR